jgi:hypothetical protein
MEEEVHAVLGITSHKSRTLEVKGFHKTTPESDIAILFSSIEEPLELDFSSRKARRSKIYVTYKNVNVATEMVHKLHQYDYHGAILSVRYELGFDEEGSRYIDHSSHNTIIRQVQSDKESSVSVAERLGFTYSYNSVTVDEAEFPFPSGLYLSRLLSLTRSLSPSDPLLDILTNPRLCASNKHPKEVSEAIAMADGVERAIKRVYGVSSRQLTNCNVDVYVVGDGKVPMGCACLCLHLPEEWQYHSIDPLLEPIPPGRLGEYAGRFNQFRGVSQDFVVSGQSEKTGKENSQDGISVQSESLSSASPHTSIAKGTLSIVVACHSHAPLSEFWGRVPSPKLAVVMPCCAHYSDLPGHVPIMCFEDFEVYSPKRCVSVYSG